MRSCTQYQYIIAREVSGYWSVTVQYCVSQCPCVSMCDSRATSHGPTQPASMHHYLDSIEPVLDGADACQRLRYPVSQQADCQATSDIMSLCMSLSMEQSKMASSHTTTIDTASQPYRLPNAVLHLSIRCSNEPTAAPS